MSGGGLFSFNIGEAETVKKYLVAVDSDVSQYLSTLISQVGQLEQTWNSPNKGSFINDWNSYCSSLGTINNIGPKLVAALTQEINLVQQAEGVNF
jgi:uncharacterized protein YukE